MTAVEWLVKQLNKQGFAQVVTDEEIEQAKAMEKQQIVDAYNKGDENGANRVYYHDNRNNVSAEQYYNETFKPE